jgi:hypothetical protein
MQINPALHAFYFLSCMYMNVGTCGAIAEGSVFPLMHVSNLYGWIAACNKCIKLFYIVNLIYLLIYIEKLLVST